MYMKALNEAFNASHVTLGKLLSWLGFEDGFRIRMWTAGAIRSEM